MNSTLEKILEHSLQLFAKYGIRSVSMDDIARNMGMSKKTLYQYIDNKADLVNKGMQRHLDMERAFVTKIFDADKNAIDEMVEIGNFVYLKLQQMHRPSLVYDLQKYYRESWQMLEKHRTEFIYTTVLQNIEQGMAEGLYRQNLKPELIARFYIDHSKIFLETDIFNTQQYQAADIYIELLKYHIYGIASEKGMQYLRDNLATIKNNQYVK
ncbi:MAG: TetR/AcrR family transcriptional regulator [Chitinophagales bacterium]